jgi:hypothetical protein
VGAWRPRTRPRVKLRLVVADSALDRRERAKDDWFVLAMVVGLFVFAAAFVASL